MKFQNLITLLLLPFFFSACNAPKQQIDIELVGAQLLLLDDHTVKEIELVPETPNGDLKLVPRTIEDGKLKVVPGGDWTSGFYPGTLWYMYEMTGEESWKDLAVKYTEALEEQQFNASNHDVGFRMFCSYGNAYRLSGDESYVPILVQSAKTLISRYYEGVGCIRSWNFNEEKWQCPVIIDNMMNLELLFWATEKTGDPIYREIAVSHAHKTMQHQFREDYSTVHVVDYDTITGAVRQRNTHQGYSDESSWARGQSWGLYGYTLCYRFTKDERFLNQALQIAHFLLSHPRLPDDGIPYWDFDAPDIPDAPRDVSAGMVMASALYELSSYVEDGAGLKASADRMLESAWEKYRSPARENFGFILDHSVGHLPNDSEVDVPINYADYYFMEALKRKKALENTQK